MSSTLTVRLPDDLVQWLEKTSREAGIPKGRLIRMELERARQATDKPFLRLAGLIDGGPADLSTRKGFAGQPYPGTRKLRK
jgi:hypothetical protein